MHPRAPTVVLLILCALLLAPLLLSPASSPTPSGPRPTAVPVAAASSGGVQTLAAALGFGLTLSPTQADPKDVVVVTVYFNNTGTQAAPAAWINLTASSHLTFQSDTAAGNLSGYPDYRFANLALGLHAFTVRFVVAVGTPPGSRASVSATLVYADGTGAEQFVGPASATVLVGVANESLYLGWGALNPSILTPVAPTGPLLPAGTFTLVSGGPSLTFDLTPPLVRSFRALNATAVLYLQPTSPPASLDLNLTLVDVNGATTTAVTWTERTYTLTSSGYWTLTYPFPSLSYLFGAGHQIGLQILNAAATGEAALLATNASAQPSRIVFQTSTYVSIDSLQPALSPTTYLSPRSSLVITANVSDPFGSAQILTAHVNVTGPSGPIVTWTTTFPLVMTDPSSPSAWKLFRLVLSPPLADGTYSVEVTAVEPAGVTDIADGAAVVRAPAFTFQKIASPNQGKSGTKITYFLWYNNTGTGLAGHVWLNDTLPGQVNFQNSSAPVGTVLGSTYGWTFTNVAVGPHVLQIFVQVKGGVSTIAYIRNAASLNYSDPQGFLWAPLQSHADVVLNGPYLTLTQTSMPAASVHANQTVVYSVTITNTGEAAAQVWVNDTVPSGLVYLSDTATGVGAVRTVAGNTVHWSFPGGMGSGTSTPTVLAFTMTARAASGLVWGTPLPNTIGLNDTSATGLLMPDLLSVLRLTLDSPWISSAAAGFGVPTAVPNVGLPLFMNFTNAGNEPAGTVWINLTLGPSLQLVDAGPNATLSGSVVSIVLANQSVGADSYELIVSAAASVTDRQVLSVTGTLRAADGYGNLLPQVTVATGSVAVALPSLSFSLSPASLTAEAGTPVPFVVTGGNTGSGTASTVWLNLTLPPGLTYVNDTFGVAPAVVGSAYSWSWRDYAPGAHAYGLVLRVDGDAPDRTTANLTFRVEAQDLGGNPTPSSTFGAAVDIVASSFALQVWASTNRTAPGGTFTYTLVAENQGSRAAQTLWLTDAIDPHLTVLSYSGSTVATGTSTLNWTFQDVLPGQRIEIAVTVQVAQGTPGNTQISNTLAAEYTNSVGTVLTTARSVASTVSVLPDLTPLLLILGAGSALGAVLVFVVYRRYRVRIEDVFLVYRDGILVSHLTQGDGLEKDEDQLSGMLTAVQDFVKDAFTYGEHRELHQLEFGDYHVLIERGKLVYLAVVYQGRDSGLIRKKVRTVLDQVEAKYGHVFEAWDGEMAQVEGTRDLLREGFVEDKHPWSLVQSKGP